jgi:DNA-binding response OmpR family regulator
MSVILVVDDEEDIRELVGIYVRRQTAKRRWNVWRKWILIWQF